jgi:hypothetical protein
MKKAGILSVLIFFVAVFCSGCGGSGERNASGSAAGPAQGGDGSSASESSSSDNSAPGADAGLDQTASRGTAAYLDGSGSSDMDGDLLSFQWTILSQPNGSTATLSRADQPSPYFTPDQEGNYVIQLIVIDAQGLASSPDTVTVSTVNSSPVADAGADQSIASLGTLVTLGGESWDPDGDSIAYSWTMKSKPAESLAVLSDPASPHPTLTADVYGDYILELTVSDAWSSSALDTVKVSFGNLKPVADAGSSSAQALGSVAYLDGSASYDPNGDPITYSWAFVSKPTGSTAVLAAPTTVNPYSTPDMAGTYVLSLVVSDGLEKSDPGSATVTVFSAVNPTIQHLLDALQAVNNLPPSAFKNPNMKKTLAKKINNVIESVDSGYYLLALDKLQGDILKKMDGCDKKGSPEQNDWITNCGAQGEVHPHLALAIAELKSL